MNVSDYPVIIRQWKSVKTAYVQSTPPQSTDDPFSRSDHGCGGFVWSSRRVLCVPIDYLYYPMSPQVSSQARANINYPTSFLCAFDGSCRKNPTEQLHGQNHPFPGSDYCVKTPTYLMQPHDYEFFIRSLLCLANNVLGDGNANL